MGVAVFLIPRQRLAREPLCQHVIGKRRADSPSLSGQVLLLKSRKQAEAYWPTRAKSVPQPKISIDWSGIRPLSRTGSHCISSLGFIKVYTAFRPRSITASFAPKNTQTNKAGISRLIYQILKAAFCPHYTSRNSPSTVPSSPLPGSSPPGSSSPGGGGGAPAC